MKNFLHTSHFMRCLFLLMGNGVENYHGFVYLVTNRSKCCHFSGVNGCAEEVLNLGGLLAPPSVGRLHL